MLVVEQDHHIGGTAHFFRRGGFAFPAGPISVTVPDYITRFLCSLDVKEAQCFIRDHFQVRRGYMDVMISVPLDQLAKQLSDSFLQERKGIIEVINILDEVIDALMYCSLRISLKTIQVVLQIVPPEQLLSDREVYLPMIALKAACRMTD